METFQGPNDFVERKVARTSPEDNHGLGVSTVFCHQFNCYETALKDAVRAYPVERYDTFENAEKGHKQWIEKSKTLEIVKTLDYPDIPGTWVLLRRIKLGSK